MRTYGYQTRRIVSCRRALGTAIGGASMVASTWPCSRISRAKAPPTARQHVRERSPHGGRTCVSALRRELKRDDFSLNRHPALASCLSMIFFRKPLHTFRDHALSEHDLFRKPPHTPDQVLDQVPARLFRDHALGHHNRHFVQSLNISAWPFLAASSGLILPSPTSCAIAVRAS